MKDVIIVVLLVGLLLFAGVQTFQISALKEKLESGTLTGAPRALGVSSTTNAPRQAPQMVGGC